MAKKHQNEYTVESFPKTRRFALDTGHVGRGKRAVRGLLEMNVAEARQYIREHKARTGEETLSDVAGDHLAVGCGSLTQRNPKYAGPNDFALGHTFPS